MRPDDQDPYALLGAWRDQPLGVPLIAAEMAMAFNPNLALGHITHGIAQHYLEPLRKGLNAWSRETIITRNLAAPLSPGERPIGPAS